MDSFLILFQMIFWKCVVGCFLVVSVFGEQNQIHPNHIELPVDALPDAHELDSIGIIAPVALDEISGMIPSIKKPGWVWAHNDSGDDARLFCFPIPEPHRFAWGSEYKQLFLNNIEHMDWEDLMIGSDGALYLADTGNNLKTRKTLNIFKFDEPDPDNLKFAGATDVVGLLFQYENPDKSSNQGPVRKDCEAICEFNNGILLFTKRLSSASCQVFYLPDVIGNKAMDPDSVKTATFLFEITNFRGVSAVDSRVIGEEVHFAALSYGLVWYWKSALDEPLANFGERVIAGSGLRIRAGQCETIYFQDDHTLILTNEGRDVFRLRIENNNLLY